MRPFVLLFVAGILRPAAAAQQADPLATWTKVSPTAPVMVDEMADFQRPACREFALTTFPAIERDYIQTRKVRSALADSAGVRHDSLLMCVNSRATIEAITQNAQGSVRAGANATPSFYIEGGLASGAIPAPEFSRILDSIYRAKSGAR